MLNLFAIDFETAIPRHMSICEAAICVIKAGMIVETKSWQVRPEDNACSYWEYPGTWNPSRSIETAPEIAEVWSDYMECHYELYMLFSRNASFDVLSRRKSLAFQQLKAQEVDYYCTFRAVRHNYEFETTPWDAYVNSSIFLWASLTAQVTIRKCERHCSFTQ